MPLQSVSPPPLRSARSVCGVQLRPAVAWAWACVADADGTRAKAAANSLAPTEAISGPAGGAHLWTHSGAYDTSS
jgi:hypothetical protein